MVAWFSPRKTKMHPLPVLDGGTKKESMKIKILARRKFTCGFSLLELMLVVAIIALISVMAMPQVNEYMKRSRSARSSQNLKTLVSGIQQFTLDKAGPPKDDTWT